MSKTAIVTFATRLTVAGENAVASIVFKLTDSAGNTLPPATVTDPTQSSVSFDVSGAAAGSCVVTGTAFDTNGSPVGTPVSTTGTITGAAALGVPVSLTLSIS